MIKKIAYFFFLCSGLCLSQTKTDSLNKLLQLNPHDTDKIKILLLLAIDYGSNNPEKALEYSGSAVAIANNAKYNKTNNACKKYAANAYRSNGVACYFLADYSKALENLQISLKISEAINDKAGASSALGWIGNTFYSKGDFEKALEALLKSLKLQETLGNKTGIAGSLNGIANIYRSQREFGKAIEYYFKSLKMREELDDLINVAYTYNNIGLVYTEADSLDKSIYYHLKCLNIVQKHNDKKGMSNSYGNIGEVYLKQKKFRDALVYLIKSLKISEGISDKNGICASYYEIGLAYSGSGDFKQAVANIYKSLVVGKEIGDKDAIKDCYQELAVVYSKTSDYKNAVENFEKYSILKDSLINEGNSKNISEMQTRFETDKKQKEIELLQKDNSIRELQIAQQNSKIKGQRIIIFSVIGGLIILVFVISLIWSGYRRKKKINNSLEILNTEINLQKSLIEEKNELITDSIDYAQNIQGSIFPSEEKIRSYFPEFFTLYLPKEIVSGDFYWLKEKSNNSCLLATAKCAENGVPGAFMSVMAFNMLENVDFEKNKFDSANVLDELNLNYKEKFKNEIKSNAEKSKIDISMIEYDFKKMELKFTGANTQIIIVSENNKAEVVNTKNNSIGIEKEKYISETIKVKKGDMIYLFTGGFSSQITEVNNLLISLAQKNTSEQMVSLKKFIDDKIGEKNLSDDVLVGGFRV